VLSSATRIYIIPDKLTEGQIDDLRDRIIELGGMNSSSAYANVVLTTLRAEKRILRQMDKDIVDRKVAVLHLSWLHDSDEKKLMQSFDKYRVVKYDEEEGEASQNFASASKSSQEQETRQFDGDDSLTEEEDDAKEAAHQSSREASLEPIDLKEGDASLDEEKEQPAWQNSEYACLRPTPLKSRYNQALVDELEVLRLQRIQAGKQEMNATAYGRAISAVKALPFALAPDPSKARNVKGIGQKIAKLIVQFYSQGHISEAESIRKDQAFHTMSKFMQLYGVGPKRAREYYSQGARTLDDVIRMGGSLGTHLHIQECLRILPDLQVKIPRSEVEEIAELIMSELDKIRPGCLYTICGGYRRGKAQSNDVDIVITDPNPTSINSQITSMEDLLRQLKKKAFITHVVNVTTPSSTFEAVYSHLDVAEVVMLPPTSSGIPVARHRRVDIIFCPYATYGAAILGWTGSRQFERDLRLLAKHRGFKFHSTGIVNQDGTRPHRTTREEDIFDLLQIPFMPPQFRNCDA